MLIWAPGKRYNDVDNIEALFGEKVGQVGNTEIYEIGSGA